MEYIQNQSYIEYYYKKYEMETLFTKDMKNHMEFRRFEVNDYLCREDEPLNYLLFLVKGKAKVCRSLENGKSLLLSIYTPFQVLGDIEIVNDKPAASTTQALVECHVITIPMNVAREELSNDLKFLKFACKNLSDKLSVISLNSTINLLYPVENRLASYMNAAVLADTEASDCVFRENLTHLAELLGTSYRHLLRTIKELCEKDVIKKVDGGYQIINRVALERIAGDLYQKIK